MLKRILGINDEDIAIIWWIFSTILACIAGGVATVYWMLL